MTIPQRSSRASADAARVHALLLAAAPTGTTSPVATVRLIIATVQLVVGASGAAWLALGLFAQWFYRFGIGCSAGSTSSRDGAWASLPAELLVASFALGVVGAVGIREVVSGATDGRWRAVSIAAGLAALLVAPFVAPALACGWLVAIAALCLVAPLALRQWQRSADWG